MDGETLTAVDESIDTAVEKAAPRRPTLSLRLLGVAFGMCCYIAFAAFYFLRPGNPVLSLGPARFTADSLLEIVFTIMALPVFGLTYLYGTRHHREIGSFAVPDLAIDLLFGIAIVWVALGNGIHLTAKLEEQMLSVLKDQQGPAIKTNFHWIRQVVGHVFPHIGWQLLFAALMLGQLKRPYRGREPNAVVWPCGAVFGLLFAHGAIAGTCTHIGFALTAVSFLVFWSLARRSNLPSGEIPVLKFFFSSQVTFMLVVVIYWVVFHGVPI